MVFSVSSSRSVLLTLLGWLSVCFRCRAAAIKKKEDTAAAEAAAEAAYMAQLNEAERARMAAEVHTPLNPSIPSMFWWCFGLGLPLIRRTIV